MFNLAGRPRPHQSPRKLGWCRPSEVLFVPDLADGPRR
ncbi:MAG: hypothetical protein AVDCRST_MAG49-3302 [uncultured Thermomicrobiales bacterium]|uniref:Uncharacterized protein n=1 Tax=uncultured Thermomicrobiales bacterium TaxID=1645740 RepID=A0A6J4V6A5_9BACT|nr:MAG: hypothetical protein AVDCRST_MAG49-3302 [uncultured Thermomicrobiales bacterium]